MIYDHLLFVCDPPEGAGAPFQGTLVPRARHYYAERTVYHRRFWEALAAGSRVDRMVQIPDACNVLPTSYVVLDDALLYRIEEAQYTTDEDGLPVTNLSLKRVNLNYELCKPAL